MKNSVREVTTQKLLEQLVEMIRRKPKGKIEIHWHNSSVIVVPMAKPESLQFKLIRGEEK
jgi:hypothetical protein